MPEDGKTTPARRRRVAAGARAAGLLAAATFVNYMIWLGWDQEKDEAPYGGLSGPYQPWQVVGVVLGLGALAAAGGWRGHPVAAAVAVTLTMTVCWSVDAATSDDSGLWAVGAVMVLVGTSLGVGVVALCAAALRGRGR
ncbi:hypothetical protein [Streptosporangium sp. NPDC000396]|uniref:hypothetical protein n=1 Tax=Streptosporangium sp. NPDC000396 TaxID=3366185 RepID=UPI0036B56F11